MHCQESWRNYITGETGPCEEAVQPGEHFCRDHLPDRADLDPDYRQQQRPQTRQSKEQQ